eukprot:2240896-Alexandrium_andersonii.AAC.1
MKDALIDRPDARPLGRLSAAHWTCGGSSSSACVARWSGRQKRIHAVTRTLSGLDVSCRRSSQRCGWLSDRTSSSAIA